MELWAGLRQGLARARAVFRSLLSPGSDPAELEQVLLGADVGVKATQILLGRVRMAGEPAERRRQLEAAIVEILGRVRCQPPTPSQIPPLV
ncbi:MAG: signal recognition particle receptor subunit alpha, partial [candidate division WOR-3 bacterium]